MGLCGAAGETEGVRVGPAPLLAKPEAAAHVASPWPCTALGFGRGYVINLVSWRIRHSTCLKTELYDLRASPLRVLEAGAECREGLPPRPAS